MTDSLDRISRTTHWQPMDRMDAAAALAFAADIHLDEAVLIVAALENSEVYFVKDATDGTTDRLKVCPVTGNRCSCTGHCSVSV